MCRQQVVRFIAEFHDAARDFKQCRAGFGQFHASRFADQEFDAIVLFEVLDLNCQCRLADVQDLGRRGEAAVLGNGVEGTDLAENY